LKLEGEGAVGERAGEVVEALALDGGEQPPISGVDGVVPGGNGRAHGAGAVLGEAVGVAPAAARPAGPPPTITVSYSAAAGSVAMSSNSATRRSCGRTMVSPSTTRTAG
jgi:hypothetical protein